MPTASPLRMFIGEVPFHIRHNSFKNSCSIRLMGRVINILSQVASTTRIENDEGHLHPKRRQSEEFGDTTSSGFKKQTDSDLCLIIDDGTGIIDIVDRRRLSISVCSTQQSTESKDNNVFKLLDFNDVSLISVGQLVDCIGEVHYVVSDIQNFHTEDIKEQAHTVWLEASSISIVTNPQEEILRELELSTRINLPSDEISLRNVSCNYVINEDSDNHNAPTNRILLPGILGYELNNFYHCRYPRNCVIFKTEDALRYINYSKNFGGISANDLMILFGATTLHERRLVNMAIAELQNQGMVYLKDCKYFPL